MTEEKLIELSSYYLAAFADENGNVGENEKNLAKVLLGTEKTAYQNNQSGWVEVRPLFTPDGNYIMEIVFTKLMPRPLFSVRPDENGVTRIGIPSYMSISLSNMKPVAAFWRDDQLLFSTGFINSHGKPFLISMEYGEIGLSYSIVFKDIATIIKNPVCRLHEMRIGRNPDSPILFSKMPFGRIPFFFYETMDDFINKRPLKPEPPDMREVA